MAGHATLVEMEACRQKVFADGWEPGSNEWKLLCDPVLLGSWVCHDLSAPSEPAVC